MQKRDRRAKARNSGVREGAKPGRRPTPIWVTPRARSLLVFAVLALLALLAYAAPAVPLIAAGGFALALALSFPVRVISRFLPRPATIAASFVLLILSSVLALSLLAPMLVDQMGALLEAAPRLARQAELALRGVVEPLADRGLLPGTPDELLAGLAADLFVRVEELVQDLLGGAFRFAGQAFYFIVGVLGALVVASYMLADARKIKAACLRLSPRRYKAQRRRPVGRLRLLALALHLGPRPRHGGAGVISAIALWILGVPYAAALGLWVALTAVVPLVGAWIGAVPGVLVSLAVSPATAAAVAVLFLIIQQVEGNFLTPRVMGSALRIHPVLILLSVIGGGQLAGPVGIILAVPVLAVGRVLLDFVRPRLRVGPMTAPGKGPLPDG